MDSNWTGPLVVVVGETASGKSALAMELARRFHGELICADSWTVYRGFDIGSAKPSAEDLAAVRHHLLDIADPAVGFSAVEFQRQARAAIDDIGARGRLPIIVGGTGLYIDSLLYDYAFLPAPDPADRERLSALDLPALHQLVEERGLDASGIDMRNKRRVIRLIENDGVRPGRGGLREHTLMLGIRVDRGHLRERVTARVDAMLAAGLEAEVRRLAEQYGWEAEPMKGIGYREWQPYVAGSQSLELTRERIIAATMGLAKRQRTWFRRNKSIHWFEPPGLPVEAVELVTTFLSDNSGEPAPRSAGISME